MGSSSSCDWKPSELSHNDKIFKYESKHGKKTKIRFPKKIDLRKEKNFEIKSGNSDATRLFSSLLNYNLYEYDFRGSENNFKDCFSLIKNEKFKFEKFSNLKGQIKSSLVEGIPVMFGFSYYDSFKDCKDKLSIKEDEQSTGSTCGLIVGYDADGEYWIVKNALGDEFGDNGFFKIPFDYLFSDSNFSSDFWRLLYFKNTEVSGEKEELDE